MKALNNKEVLLSHLKFAMYMVVLVILTQFAVFSYFKTSEAEVDEIKYKTGDCEKIFAEQISICDGFTEILDIYHRFDTKEGYVNAEELKRAIAERKMKMSSIVNQLPEKDAAVHKFLIAKFDGLMNQRDSITSLRKEETAKRNALVECNNEYRKKRYEIDKIGRAHV